jgi:hypothetical protein
MVGVTTSGVTPGEAVTGKTAGDAMTGTGVLLDMTGNGAGESAVGVPAAVTDELATGIGGGGGRDVTTALMLGKTETLTMGEMGALGVT